MNFRTVIGIGWVAVALVLAEGVQADEARELAAVVVVGESRGYDATPPHSRVALPNSVEASQTLTREDIEAIRPRDVFDLMEGSLGMSISRQGSRINNFSINRGGNVAFLVDGVYLTATEAQRVVGEIPVEMIDSIQFVRDSSILNILPVMGFGARVGSPGQGVVVISTIGKGGEKNSALLRTSYASYDTWKSSGSFKQSWEDGRLQLGGGYQHSQSNGKPQWNNGYDRDTFMLNGGWKDREFVAMASVFVNKGEQKIQRYIGVMDGATSALKPGQMDASIWKYDPRDTELYTFTFARHWNDRHTTALIYGRTKVDGNGWYYSATTNPDTVAARYFKDQSSDLNLSHTILDERNTFKVGVQRVSYYQLTEAATTPREEEIYGAYFTDEYRIAPSWSVDGSARMDRKHVSQGGDKFSADGSTMKLSNDTWTDEASLLSLGTSWQINPTWRVSGRYAYGRTPTPDTITTANDQKLPAERLSRYEIGLEAKLDPALQVSLTPFYYLANDAKVATASNVSVFNSDTSQYETLNVYTTANKVTRKGLDLAFKGRLADGVLGYDVGWSRFSDDSITPSSGQLEAPRNRYTLRIDWNPEPWNASLSVLNVDEYCHYFNGASASQGACLPTGGFTTVNLNIGRKLGRGVSVSVFGQNLTNEHYYTRHKTGSGGPSWAQSQGAIIDMGATYGVEVRVDL